MNGKSHSFEETVQPKVGAKGLKAATKGGIHISPAQIADIREFSDQKGFDVQEAMKKPKMHDSVSCTTCNSHITRRATSNLRVISSTPVAVDITVERGINESEFHDWCCSSCSSYVNKRIILHKRDIAPEKQAIRPRSEHMIVSMPGEIERESSTPDVSRVDIVKAAVYGGLLQSITSLSVVVSAAGGDASTLNIVALALANVFGGLLVLAHNLRALKQEHNSEHYEKQLGRPGHFLLHATIAIISYLVFGLMSPIIYGFSFYKSDDKYLKLATLAVSSLVCITILSIGKAYVQRPPKAYMKTIFSYVSLGVMVAGPGYIAGGLANMLLKKLEVFDPSSPNSIPMIQAEVIKASRLSY